MFSQVLHEGNQKIFIYTFHVLHDGSFKKGLNAELAINLSICQLKPQTVTFENLDIRLCKALARLLWPQICALLLYRYLTLKWLLCWPGAFLNFPIFPNLLCIYQFSDFSYSLYLFSARTKCFWKSRSCYWGHSWCSEFRPTTERYHFFILFKKQNVVYLKIDFCRACSGAHLIIYA